MIDVENTGLFCEKPAPSQQRSDKTLTFYYNHVSLRHHLSVVQSFRVAGLGQLCRLKLFQFSMQFQPGVLKFAAAFAEFSVTGQGCDAFIAPGVRV